MGWGLTLAYLKVVPELHSKLTLPPANRMRFLVRASYLQIYNEQISDLLKPERSNLAIREDRKRGVFVEGLSEWVVSCGKPQSDEAAS